MNATPLALPRAVLTSSMPTIAVPEWMESFRPRVVKPAQLSRLAAFPDMTIVQEQALGSLLLKHRFLAQLSQGQEKGERSSKIVFVFERADSRVDSKRQLIELFSHFSRPADLEVARTPAAGKQAVDEAYAKLIAFRNQIAHGVAGSDPLGELKEVLAATQQLRASSGKLAADRVAKEFGLSVTELAGVLGRNRQTVFKTPDADSLQRLLRPFECIARLRAVLSFEHFLHWLNRPNEQLDEKTPMDVVRSGRVGVVADLAEDMLTGQPT